MWQNIWPVWCFVSAVCLVAYFLWFVFLWFIFSFFFTVCLSVTVKWLAVKTAPKMTYTVSGGALNSAQSNPVCIMTFIVTNVCSSCVVCLTAHSDCFCLQPMTSACGRRINCCTRLNFSDVQRLQKRKRWVFITLCLVGHHVTQILLLVSSFVLSNSFISNVLFLYVND